MPRPPSEPQRIAKLLARAGIASRREIERMIEEGRVAVGGVALTTPATLLASLDGVTVDGDPVAAPEPTRLFLFHKPVGVLTAERDFSGRPTIYDRLSAELPRLVPVGRLDLNTEGLLLLTTDGGLKRQLELPRTGVERAYRARAFGQISQERLEALIDGIEIDGVRYGPIDASLERRTGANVWIELVLTEGKNREVRRVLEHLGLRVSRLIRTRYGPFVLGDLPAGEIGEVRQVDLEEFRKSLARERTSSWGPITAPRSAPGRAKAARVTRPRLSVRQAPRKGARQPHGGEDQPRSSGPNASKAATPTTTDAEAPKPPRPKRKPGWARAKPHGGPARK